VADNPRVRRARWHPLRSGKAAAFEANANTLRAAAAADAVGQTQKGLRTKRRAPMKTIRDKTDLALHGASPAFEQPLHVGRPNIVSRAAFLANVERILDSHWLTNNGPVVREFERRIAEYLGVKHCVAMCNGTIALEIAIRALGLQGEVIVPSWTFVATAHSLYWQGITPVFADIDPATHNLDPDAVRRMITPRTTGIIGVHLWGRAAAIDELQAIADAHGLKLMFDAAHAFGSTYKGVSIGRFGACEVLSFHATKAFNTMEGGAVVTDDDELAEKMRLMRNFGFIGYDNVIHPGTNGKMVEVCAAMGLANLDSFDEIVAVNRRNHAAYKQALAGISGISMLDYDPAERNSHHYVVLELDDRCAAARDDIIAALHAENVLARKYFWPGAHRMQPYRDLFPHSGLMLANTEMVANRVVILPSGCSVSQEAVDTIGSIIRLLALRSA
jgi:dTDP-4-amino-4,6-dideoxygalactose transaminase